MAQPSGWRFQFFGAKPARLDDLRHRTTSSGELFHKAARSLVAANGCRCNIYRKFSDF
jgi:hypothetical protein